MDWKSKVHERLQPLIWYGLDLWHIAKSLTGSFVGFDVNQDKIRQQAPERRARLAMVPRHRPRQTQSPPRHLPPSHHLQQPRWNQTRQQSKGQQTRATVQNQSQCRSLESQAPAISLRSNGEGYLPKASDGYVG